MRNNNWGGKRINSGRNKLNENFRKNSYNIYINKYIREDISKYGKGNNFSQKALEIIETEIKRRKSFNESEDIICKKE